MTIADFLRHWVSRKKTTRAAGTASRYNGIVEAFLAHLGPVTQRRRLATADNALLQGFIDAQFASGKSAHTVSLVGKILSYAFQSGQRAGFIVTNPAVHLELPDFKMQEREEFTSVELESLLSEARDTEWETAIMLSAFCGCRLGDSVRMKWSAVNLEDARLTFTPEKTSRGSRCKTLTLPLAPRLLTHLKSLACKNLMLNSKFLMPGLSRQVVGGRNGLSLTFRDLMKRAGVNGITIAKSKGCAARSFNTKTFHSLRHFFVSQLYRNGADFETVKAGAGISSLKTHERYDHNLRDRTHNKLRIAIENFPGST